MNVDELYKEFNLKPYSTEKISVPLKHYVLPYEKIVEENSIPDINFENIRNIEEISTDKGAFYGSGFPMVIYERRHINPSGNPEHEFPYLYHMFWCKRLREHFGDKLNDFKNKFVGSYRMDGNFNVFVWHSDVQELRHHDMCKDCYCKLAEYYGGIRKFRGICGMKNWKTDYVAQAESKAFSLEKFYQNIRSGKIRGIKGITNVDTFRMYRKKDPYYRDLGWAKYAYELKKANGFKCEECGKVFIDDEGNYIEKSLQVHHVDKNPLNVSLDNHKVLCVECHRKEHMGKVYVDVE